MTPAERRRALQGRVLELSGGARIGQGVKVLRHQYKVHQPKRERDLLEAKERRIDAARRKDAEDAGTYDKSFKKSLFIQKKKQRDWTKGLGPGIGKFSGGVLKISGAEITSVMGPKEGSSQTGKPKYHAKRRK
ncbi:hypothetical protein FRB99_000713 [Tulasnella sp. 403]|nr:hypothetical protein FRB99_000713 [Tulasnella sp. 403]